MHRKLQVTIAAAATITVLVAAHSVQFMPEWITDGWVLPLTLGIGLVALIVAIAARWVLRRFVDTASQVIAERIAYAEQRGRGEAYVAILEGHHDDPSQSTRGQRHLRPLR